MLNLNKHGEDLMCARASPALGDDSTSQGGKKRMYIA